MKLHQNFIKGRGFPPPPPNLGHTKPQGIPRCSFSSLLLCSQLRTNIWDGTQAPNCKNINKIMKQMTIWKKFRNEFAITLRSSLIKRWSRALTVVNVITFSHLNWHQNEDDTVEPQYSVGPVVCQNLFAVMRFHYTKVLFHIYLNITGVTKKKKKTRALFYRDSLYRGSTVVFQIVFSAFSNIKA